jgi:hypothetical protein
VRPYDYHVFTYACAGFTVSLSLSPLSVCVLCLFLLPGRSRLRIAAGMRGSDPIARMVTSSNFEACAVARQIIGDEDDEDCEGHYTRTDTHTQNTQMQRKENGK